jgi:LPS export ABC transporter protein LptC
VGALFASCLEREYDLDALRTPDDFSIEEARDVEIFYSDSARLRVKIEGPLLRRYIYRFRVEEEFPENVHVTFYNDQGEANAWLSAKYAIRKPQDNQTIVRDSVVLFNSLGEKMEGLELIWDENAEEIHTDKFVRITRADEIIYSRGFKSNQNFTEYTLYAVEGDMLMEDLGLGSDR